MSHPFQRNSGNDVLSLFVSELLSHICSDKSWRNGIAGNPAGCQLSGRRFGQANQARLGRCIVGLTCIAHHARYRSNIDDRTLLPFQKMRAYMLHHIERAFQIGCNDAVKFFLFHHQQQIIFGNPRIVDQNIQPAEMGNGRFHCIAALLVIADIAAVRLRVPPQCVNLCADCFCRLSVRTVADGYVGTVFGHFQGNGFSNPP